MPVSLAWLRTLVAGFSLRIVNGRNLLRSTSIDAGVFCLFFFAGQMTTFTTLRHTSEAL